MKLAKSNAKPSGVTLSLSLSRLVKISKIFSQNLVNSYSKIHKFKFLWICAKGESALRVDASAFSTPRNDGVEANSRIYSCFATARNDEWAGKFTPFCTRKAHNDDNFHAFFPNFHSTLSVQIDKNFALKDK